MGVHFERGVVGGVKHLGRKPVTLGIGIDMVWQGGVDTADQLKLLALMQEFEKKYPSAELEAAIEDVEGKRNERAAKKLGTATSGPSSSTPSQSPSVNGGQPAANSAVKPKEASKAK